MITPAFSKHRVHLVHLKLAIDIGSFVVMTNKTIARLLDAKDDEGTDELVLLLPYYIVNSERKEVSCKGAASQWSKAEDIRDIVFVLLDQDRKLETFTWLGREDTYTSVDNGGEEQDKYTFPCDSPFYTLEQSVSRIIWDELQEIRKALRRLLSSSSLHQGTFSRRTSKISISADTFQYIIRQVTEKPGATCSTGKLPEIVNEISDGLQAFSRKRTCVSSTIEFEQAAGTRLLTSVLGQYSIVGLRHRRPKLSDPIRKLEQNDGIHYLVEKDGIVCARMEYARGMRCLSLRVAYSPYFVSWSATNIAEIVPTTLLKDMIHYNRKTPSNNTILPVTALPSNQTRMLNSWFEFNGLLTQVTAEDAASALLECTSSSGITFSLARAVVYALVCEYLE